MIDSSQASVGASDHLAGIFSFLSQILKLKHCSEREVHRAMKNRSFLWRQALQHLVHGAELRADDLHLDDLCFPLKLVISDFEDLRSNLPHQQRLALSVSVLQHHHVRKETRAQIREHLVQKIRDAQSAFFKEPKMFESHIV
jgi:hypothetical protein